MDDLFHHVLAVLHDPAYREANAGALRMEWPRNPLPGWPDGDAAGAAEALSESAARGRKLGQLLDSDTPVPGVTEGALRPEAAAIAVPATTDDRNMAGDDFALTAGWGHFGSGDAVMPGQGRVVQRAYTPEERATLAGATPILGETTYDIYLNKRAYWRNVPAGVWTYKLGGYQVLKKWLSYRERTILRRPLKPDEVQHFAETARRIAAILLLRPTRTPRSAGPRAQPPARRPRNSGWHPANHQFVTPAKAGVQGDGRPRPANWNPTNHQHHCRGDSRIALGWGAANPRRPATTPPRHSRESGNPGGGVRGSPPTLARAEMHEIRPSATRINAHPRAYQPEQQSA